MNTKATPQKFIFNTVFDDDGGMVVTQAARQKRAYTPEEVEAIRAEAFAQGEQSAMARAQGEQAVALQHLAHVAEQGLSALAQVAHDHKIGVAELSLLCARKIAAEALDRFPEAPVAAALEALEREIESMPRLVLRCAQPTPELQAWVEEAARRAGFDGALVLRPEAGLDRAAFVLEWPDGQARFDPAATSQRLTEALHNALAAEGLHGEALASGVAHGEESYG